MKETDFLKITLGKVTPTIQNSQCALATCITAADVQCAASKARSALANVFTFRCASFNQNSGLSRITCGA